VICRHNNCLKPTAYIAGLGKPLCGKRMRVFHIIILSITLVSCGAFLKKSPAVEGNQVGCQEELSEYELVLKWNESGEQQMYEMHLSQGFPAAKNVCGLWINEKGIKLNIVQINGETPTLMLQLPITDNSWLLKMEDFGGARVSGILLQETWGFYREVGTFEITGE